jgi:hypothetical protein
LSRSISRRIWRALVANSPSSAVGLSCSAARRHPNHPGGKAHRRSWIYNNALRRATLNEDLHPCPATRRFPAGLRQRGAGLGDLAAGGGRILTAFCGAGDRLQGERRSRLNLVSRQEAMALGGRIAEVEQRLDARVRERAA